MLDANGEPADRNNLNAAEGTFHALWLVLPFWALMFVLLPWWLVLGLALLVGIGLVVFVR